MMSIQYSIRHGSSPRNPAYNTVFSPKFKVFFSSKPSQIPTLGIRIALELEKIGFKRNTVSRISIPATLPWLLRHPEIELSLHSPPLKPSLRMRFLKSDLTNSLIALKKFHHIYTDGFKMGHIVSSALCHKRGTSAIRLPGATGIFNAELQSVLLALDVVQKSKKNFLLLSDTYSSLIALGGSHVDQDVIYKYTKTYNTLTNSGKTVILCWIQDHAGIPGNERADRVAKAALSLPIPPVKVSAMDFLPRAKLLMRKEWQEIWNCCDGNKLHAVSATVGVTKQNDSVCRRDAVIRNRLQIGHTRATHAYLLADDEALGATCYTSLTVNHILIECPQYNRLRQQ